MLTTIHSYFPELTQKQIAQLTQLWDLYSEWNLKVNVISRKDIDNFYEHHVLHSLGIAKVHQFEAGAQVIDVGTGGGFPGIPLAILFPEVQFHLVDSIAKKINVVKDVAKQLNLSNVTAQQARVEELSLQFDYSVSRAVARMRTFYHWVHQQLKPGATMLYLKGGDIAEEMKELKKPYEVFDLSDFFKEDFFETKKVVKVKV